jgi:carbamoyltransferase
MLIVWGNISSINLTTVRKFELYDHHLCHAASTFYGSGFPEATVICLDFSGDSSSGVVIHARGDNFRELTLFGRHNSLGLFYGMLRQYLGYQMTNDEYKVVGLSYGSPRYLDQFTAILRPNGLNYELDGALDKRSRDKEIFTSDFSVRQERIFYRKARGPFGTSPGYWTVAGPARPAARGNLRSSQPI